MGWIYEIFGALARRSSARQRHQQRTPSHLPAAEIPQTPENVEENLKSIGPKYPAFGAEYAQFMQGTSMSSPVTSGALSQMFEKDQKKDSAVK